MSPLDATLVTLVPAVGTFVLLRWLARRRGALPLPPTLLLAEVATLALLVPAALALEPLGLGSLAPWVVAGLFAVLGCHALAELVALRPLLNEDATRRRPGPSWLFVLLPFLVYAATLPWVAGVRPPDGDEPYYLLVAHSLAEDFDTDLSDDYAERSYHAFTPRTVEPQPGDPRGDDGELYSRHDPLLPTVLAPALALGGRLGALLMMAFLAALAAWATLRLARVVFPRHQDECLWAYGLFALTPPMLIYAHQVWTEVPAAALAAWALGSILLAFPDPDEASDAPPHRRSWRTWAGLTLALVLLPVLKLRFLPIAGGLVLVLIHQVWRRRRQGVGGAEIRVAGAVLAALAVACTALLVVNLQLFGRALKITTPEQLADQFFAPVPFVRGLFGLFWDLGFGLFGAAPVWLILVPALVLILTQRDLRRRLGPALLLVAGPTLLLVAPRTEWFGGFSPPFRYALVVLPLAAVALVPALARRRQPGPRAVLACLGGATAFLALLWLAMPGWTFDVADGGSHLVDRLEVATDADVGRLLPSYTRPRLASWLWPPLSALAVFFAWRWPQRRDSTVSPALAALVGLTVLAVGLAALPAAGRLLPTRVVEFEDPWVTHRGGHLYPEPWTMARVKYTGGWVLRPGESVRVPAVSGGGAADLHARLLFVDNGPAPFAVVVRIDGEEVARWQEREEPWSADIDTDERWEERRATVPDWPEGGVLELSGEGTSPDGVLLDRLEIAWR